MMIVSLLKKELQSNLQEFQLMSTLVVIAFILIELMFKFLGLDSYFSLIVMILLKLCVYSITIWKLRIRTIKSELYPIFRNSKKYIVLFCVNFIQIVGVSICIECSDLLFGFKHSFLNIVLVPIGLLLYFQFTTIESIMSILKRINPTVLVLIKIVLSLLSILIVLFLATFLIYYTDVPIQYNRDTLISSALYLVVILIDVTLFLKRKEYA